MKLKFILFSVLSLSAHGLVLRRDVKKTTGDDGSVTTTTTDGDGNESWVTESPTKLGSVTRSGPIPFPGVRQLANLFGVSNGRFDELINQAAAPILEQSNRDLDNRINAALAN